MENLEVNSAKCKNAAGFAGIWLTDVSEVQSITINNEQKRTVVFATGGSWGTVERAKNINKTDIQEDGVRNVDISCDYFGVPDYADPKLMDMTKRRYIVKLKDRNGKMWLYGNREEPMRFAYDKITDPDASGACKYVLTFYRRLSIPEYETV